MTFKDLNITSTCLFKPLFEESFGGADCVETIKECFKKQGKEIPYRNYNFEEILKEIEE